MIDSQNNLFLLATEAFKAGKTNAAEKLCLQQLQIDNHDAHCHQLIALIHTNKGNTNTAEKHYIEAIRIDNKNPEFYKNLGDLYLNTNQTSKAIETYKQALKIKPDYFQAYANMGNAYLREQKATEAINSYKQALKLRPDIAALYDNLGNALKAAGKLDDAVSSHLKAIELAPQLISAYINLAHVYRNQEQTTKAVQILQQALQFAPDSADVHFSLGESLSLKHQFTQAISHYRNAKNAKQYAHLAFSRELTTLNKLRAHAEAKELLMPYANLKHTDPDIAFHYSFLTENKSDTVQSIHDLKTVLNKPDLDVQQKQRLLFRLGDMHDELGDYNLAFQHYQSANQASTNSWNTTLFQTFIDDMLISCNRDLIDQTPKASCESELPVFIVGMPRSGKSLLEQLLATHPNILGAGELADIGARLNLKIDFKSLDYAEKVSRLSQDQIQQAANEYINECQSLASDKITRVINTTPLNFFHLGLIFRLFPQAKVIHIQRNSLDNCLACFTKRFANQQTYAFTNQLEDIGHFYQQHLKIIQHCEESLNLPIFKVSYEKLVSATKETLNEIFAYLEVDEAYDDLHSHLPGTSNLALDKEFHAPVSDQYIGIWQHYKNNIGPLLKFFDQTS